ncbi:MAG: SufS family cysteine desulfurase [Actinomycetaceae bacterium]|nr:SufS family cysteine desulfurase [Actinomycetaceae bacterium]
MSEQVSASMSIPGEDLHALRDEFPILSRQGRGGHPIAYLDAAATSQKPREVIEAEASFYRDSNAAVHRGTHLLGDESTQIFEDGRQILASFIGGRGDEIVWTKNATEGINLLALGIGHASLGRGGADSASLRIGPGDRIVVTRAEHHANLVPWQELCARTGAELAWIDLTPEGRLDLDTLGVITPNTRIVAFTHASNVTGAISPVDEVVAAARAVGALVVLDTCQSSAHMSVDVAALGVDAAVFSSHKMLGPTGVGALWAKRDLLEALPPVLTGGSMVAWVRMESADYMPVPERFEAGSQPVAQIAGWSASLRYLAGIGMDRIAAHEEALTAHLLEGIASVPGVKILGPAQMGQRLGVVAFAVDGVHPHDVGQILDSADVAVRVGHHCAIPLHQFFGVRSSTRASLSVTSTREDIDRLIEALGTVRSYFKDV